MRFQHEPPLQQGSEMTDWLFLKWKMTLPPMLGARAVSTLDVWDARVCQDHCKETFGLDVPLKRTAVADGRGCPDALRAGRGRHPLHLRHPLAGGDQLRLHRLPGLRTRGTGLSEPSLPRPAPPPTRAACLCKRGRPHPRKGVWDSRSAPALGGCDWVGVAAHNVQAEKNVGLTGVERGWDAAPL